MEKNRRWRPEWQWLPPWNMPEDPVRAVLWFLHWSLRVLVRYFFVLILAGVTYEAYLNGVIGFLGTLLVGLFVWGCLAILLAVVNVASGVSRVYSEVNRLRRNPFGFTDSSSPASQAEEEENVVEGSIITDLGEERKRRRQGV